MRYFIYLSYDGARYHGWQRQPNGLSVQQVLEEALSTLLRQPVEVVGAGRTDAGVNASMMVAHFDASLPEETVVSRLNRLLPSDIAVQRIVPVRPDAHARFSATSRTYHYYITFDKSPFLRHYAWRCPFPLDFGCMNEAASHLFDYTDFTSFSKLHTDVKTNNCRIMEARWERVLPQSGELEGAALQFEICADRFLRNMVRAIVGTMVDVGRGRLTIDEFCKIIEQKDRCAAGQSVPGNALFLANITYPGDIFL
jgi:tRNA pseudouridine38-40 synthase